MIFFNAKNDWIKNLPINQERFVSGKLQKYKDNFQIIHPDYIETINDLDKIPEIEPIYSLTKGLPLKKYSLIVNQILQLLPKSINSYEWICKKRLKSMNWIDHVMVQKNTFSKNNK